MEKYDNLRNSLKTGDIILFSGKGLLSTGIKIGSACHWSHVGMIVRFKKPDVVLLYQSSPLSKVHDYTHKSPKPGVQINLFSETCEHYNGDIALRRLKYDLSDEMLDSLSAFRQEMKHRSFETNKLEIIKSVYDGPFGKNETDLSSLFCSELIAEAYQRMGLLNQNLASNEFTPKDFSEKGSLELLLGASLGQEIELKRT
jgi:hypothetical protein